MKPQAKGAVPENGDASAILISDIEEDHLLLKSLFKDHGWTLQAARTLDSALELLGDNNAPIVITERDLQSWSWKDVLKLTQVFPKPPLVIVISRFADDYLRAEALNLGVYDVLAKPLDQREVVRVLTSAWIKHLTADMHAARRVYKEAVSEYEERRRCPKTATRDCQLSYGEQ